jgi:hypothetical protein
MYEILQFTLLQDGNDLKEALKARCPSKIDIGPVYSCNPQERLKFGGRCSKGLAKCEHDDDQFIISKRLLPDEFSTGSSFTYE